MCIYEVSSIGKAYPSVRDNTSSRERFRGSRESSGPTSTLQQAPFWVGPSRPNSTSLGKYCLQFRPTTIIATLTLISRSGELPAGLLNGFASSSIHQLLRSGFCVPTSAAPRCIYPTNSLNLLAHFLELLKRPLPYLYCFHIRTLCRIHTSGISARKRLLACS